jgi:hypothetical protein
MIPVIVPSLLNLSANNYDSHCVKVGPGTDASPLAMAMHDVMSENAL